MKILFFVSSMNSGGAERVTSTLVNAWSENGHEVTLMATFSGRGSCFYELSAGVQLVYLSDLVAIPKRTLGVQLKRLLCLRQYVKSHHPDLIISFLHNVNVAAVLATYGLRIPLIICERTDPFSARRDFASRFACHITYRYASILLVQTEAVAAKFKAAGFPSHRLHVIANPVPSSYFSLPLQTNAVETIFSLAIGRLVPGKQFELLIRMFGDISKRHANCALRIIGEGPLRGELQQAIDNLKLGSCVELVGQTNWVTDQILTSHVFVMASKQEGFPNALVEAMASGLPCVCFDCPSGPREISNNGESARLISLNDPDAFRITWEQLIESAEERRELGIIARNSIAARYSLNIILAEWDTLFRKLGIGL